MTIFVNSIQQEKAVHVSQKHAVQFVPGRQAVQLQDNRPQSLRRRQQAAALANNASVGAVAQLQAYKSQIGNSGTHSHLQAVRPGINYGIIQCVKNPQKATKIKKGDINKIKKQITKMRGIKLMGKVNRKQSLKAMKMFAKGQVIDIKQFDRSFHGHKAQDEMVSTAVTLAHASTLQAQQQYEAAQAMVEISDMARFPTAYMGHHVPGSQLQHPTSRATQTYGPTGTNHGAFDLARANVVREAADPADAVVLGITYSLNNGIQPPFAANGLQQPFRDKQGAKEAHNLREDFKDYVRGKRGAEVAANAPWNPGKIALRSVSPPRKRM